MVLADDREPFRRSAGEGDRRVGAEQDLPHRSGQLEGHGAVGRCQPAGPAAALGVLDETAAVFPVDVGDPPAATGEQQQPRALDRVGEQDRVRAAYLVAAVEDGELGRRGEDRGQLGEVPVAEAALRLRADEQHAAVGVQVAHADEVAHDRLRRTVEGREAVPLVHPGSVADPVLLKAVREQLLGDDVPWLRRGDDRLHPAAAPQQQQPGGMHKRTLVQGEEQAVAGGTCPAACTAETLQERCDGSRSVDLDDPVEVADVDAQLQRAGGDDHAVPGLGEGLLRSVPLIDRQRRMREERRHPEGTQRLTKLLDDLLRVAEHEPLLAPVQGGQHLCRVRH